MNHEEKEQLYFELADAWASGEMSAKEIADFEKKRLDDPEFDAHCRLHLKMIGTLKYQKEQEFKSMIQGVERELAQEGFFKPTPKITSRWSQVRPFLAFAASFALILSAIIWWQYNLQMTARAKALALETIATLSPLSKPERQAMIEQKDQDPFELWRRGDLKGAIAIWERQYKKSPKNTELRYFLAVCQLQRGENKTAIQLLEGLDEEARGGMIIHPAEIEDVRWYLALAFAAEGNWKKAKNLLQEIEDKHTEAKQFLEKIEFSMRLVRTGRTGMEN